MHHVPGPGDTHWYWVVYDIPPTTLSVEPGATDIGTFGTNSVNDQQEYAPPCSRGPGEKLYTITVYALSADSVHAHRLRVAVALLDGGKVAVTRGLEGVGSVITDGAAWLMDGDAVRVVR